jgi:hypothetical protein
MDAPAGSPAAEFDPNWEWFEVTAVGDPAPVWVKGRCMHLRTVPVDTLDGTIVAQLCRTCDAQLPPPSSATRES